MRNKKIAGIVAALIIAMGFLDVFIATYYKGRIFYDLYDGILSFIVGSRPYSSAIIAAVLWIILAVVIFILINAKNASSKTIKGVLIAIVAAVILMSIVQLFVTGTHSDRRQNTQQVCTRCNGTGWSSGGSSHQTAGEWAAIRTTCSRCNGTGRVR